jgi:hypothetical protein
MWIVPVDEYETLLCPDLTDMQIIEKLKLNLKA